MDQISFFCVQISVLQFNGIQTIHWAELTHKRRLSALGPGGLSEEKELDSEVRECSLLLTTVDFVRSKRQKDQTLG